MDIDIRHRHIPDFIDIKREVFLVFANDLGKRIESSLSEAIIKFIENPGSDSEQFNTTIQEKLSAEWEDKKIDVIQFFRKVIFLLLAELKMTDQMKNISVYFPRLQEQEAQISKRGEHVAINIDVVSIVTYLLQENKAYKAYTLACLVHNFAHEFFHKYVSDRYPKTDVATVFANSPEGRDKYQRDRGEIAAELYAAHFLEELALKEDWDVELSKALKEKAKVTRGRVKERTTNT